MAFPTTVTRLRLSARGPPTGLAKVSSSRSRVESPWSSMSRYCAPPPFQITCSHPESETLCSAARTSAGTDARASALSGRTAIRPPPAAVEIGSAQATHASVIGYRAMQRLRQLVAYRTLVKYLVLKEIKVRSRGTILGVLWTLMNPLLTISIYFVIFQYIFRVGIPNFLAFFLIGFLMWVFFSRTVSAAATCITENESLIRQAAFPLEALPVATGLYHLFHHAVALGIAIPLMLTIWGARLSWQMLWIIPVLIAFVCLTLAAALSLAAVGVFFRDTRDILEVGLPILFWATPIFYSRDMAPEFLRAILVFNPLSSFIEAMRAALLDAHAPSPSQLSFMTGWLAVAVVSGLWVFTRNTPRFAEEA
jgi:homopolymeric O-antigen transport system permease protein